MDAELVRTVTERVMRLLKEQGLAVPPAQPPPAAAPEPAVPAKQRTAATATPHRRPESAIKAGPIMPFGKVFVTAEALQRRLTASDEGAAIELGCNEFLTPNAADFAEAKRLTIRRAPALVPRLAPSEPGNPGRTAGQASPVKATCPATASVPASARKIGVVSAKADEKVSTLLDALARENVNLLDCNRSNYWTADLLAMCRDVAAGGLSAGVAIVPQAADAMLLAAKVKGVRPVQAAAPDGVAKALRSFGANLLILEPASSTYHQMRTMIRLLAAGGPAAEGSALLSALKELEG